MPVPMVQRVDYFTLLARAVESLERDAYAARGAIYDREHKALLKRLISSAPPCTNADIAREERAFRDAIRRIEFPGDEVPATRSAQRETAGAAWPSSSRDRVRAQRRELRAEPPQPQVEPDHGQSERKPRPRSLLRLTAAYLVVTALVLGAGTLGYGYLLGAVKVSWLDRWSWLTEWTGSAAISSSTRAVLFAATQPDSTGAQVEGKAIWGTRTEPNGPDSKPDTAVTLDVEIPDPHLRMSMVLSRNLEAGAGMSHLIELRFAKPQELPFGGISKISRIAMRGTETEGGDALAGAGVDIAPGQFMFGLLGLPDLVQQNLQRLRSESWLAIGILFANGATYTLVVEKGSAGERVIDDALAKWGQ